MLILKLNNTERSRAIIADQEEHLRKLALLKATIQKFKEEVGATSVVVWHGPNSSHKIIGLVFNGVDVDKSLWIEVDDMVWLPRPDSPDRWILHEMIECDVPPRHTYGLGLVGSVHAPTMIISAPFCYAVYKDLESKDFEREQFDEAVAEGWSLVPEDFIEKLWGN